MSADKPNYRSVEHWRTIGVTALPAGYRNVFKGEEVDYVMPCPALLLQELLYTSESWDIPVEKEGGRVRRAAHKHDERLPRDTRVVFGNADEFGYLSPANDMSNYDCTLAPGDPEQAKETPARVVP